MAISDSHCQIVVGGADAAERSIEEWLVVVDYYCLAEKVSGYIDGSVVLFVWCFGKSCRGGSDGDGREVCSCCMLEVRRLQAVFAVVGVPLAA
jgi:hypothetical protein